MDTQINETEHRSQKHPHKQNSPVFDNGAPVTQENGSLFNNVQEQLVSHRFKKKTLDLKLTPYTKVNSNGSSARMPLHSEATPVTSPQRWVKRNRGNHTEVRSKCPLTSH